MKLYKTRNSLRLAMQPSALYSAVALYSLTICSLYMDMTTCYSAPTALLWQMTKIQIIASGAITCTVGPQCMHAPTRESHIGLHARRLRSGIASSRHRYGL